MNKQQICSISILILGARNAALLEDSLSSLKTQTDITFDTVVLGDLALESVVQRHIVPGSPSTIRFMVSEGLCRAEAVSQGVQAAKGDFILCLLAGEKIAEGGLHALLETLEKAEHPCIVYGAIRLASGHTYYPGDRISLSRLTVRCEIPHCSLFPKELWIEAGGLGRHREGDDPFWSLWLSGLERDCMPRGTSKVIVYSNQNAQQLGLGATGPSAEVKEAHRFLYPPHSVIDSGTTTNTRALVVASAESVDGEIELFAAALSEALAEEGAYVDIVYVPVTPLAEAPSYERARAPRVKEHWLPVGSSVGPIVKDGSYDMALFFSVPGQQIETDILKAHSIADRTLCLTRGAPTPELEAQASIAGVTIIDVPLGIQNGASAQTEIRLLRRLPPQSPIAICSGPIEPGGSQAALAQMASRFPEDLILCFVGMLGSNQRYNDEFMAAVAQNPRVRYLGSLTEDDRAALFQEATLALVPGVSVGSLAGLIRAMSHGVPWIATPALGVGDTQGGLVTSLGGFPLTANQLLKDQAMSQRLGELGFSEFLVRHSIRASLALTRELIALSRTPTNAGTDHSTKAMPS